MVAVQQFGVCVWCCILFGVRTYDGNQCCLVAYGPDAVISFSPEGIEGGVAGIGDACQLACVDHRLDILLAVNPVLVEYAWGSARSQDVGIGCQGILADRVLLFAG